MERPHQIAVLKQKEAPNNGQPNKSPGVLCFLTGSKPQTGPNRLLNLGPKVSGSQGHSKPFRSSLHGSRVSLSAAHVATLGPEKRVDVPGTTETLSEGALGVSHPERIGQKNLNCLFAKMVLPKVQELSCSGPPLRCLFQYQAVHIEKLAGTSWKPSLGPWEDILIFSPGFKEAKGSKWLVPTPPFHPFPDSPPPPRQTSKPHFHHRKQRHFPLKDSYAAELSSKDCETGLGVVILSWAGQKHKFTVFSTCMSLL